MPFKAREDIENVNPSKINCKRKQEPPQNAPKVKHGALLPRNSKIPLGTKRPKIQNVKQQSKEEDNEVDKASCEITEVIKPVSEIVLRNTKSFGFGRSVVNDSCVGQEYIKDIWDYMKQFETKTVCPRIDYMQKQTHININMRSILIDWLIDVAVDNKMDEQCVHLAVHYIDMFLSQMLVSREKFQLLGTAAMMIAGKIEEIYPPVCQDWQYFTCNTYTREQIRRMEKLLLSVLKFDVQPPTILTFIKLLCSEHNLDKRTMYLAMFLSELVLIEGPNYLHHPPSQLATASVALARMTLEEEKPWTKQLQDFSGYSLKSLSPVVQKQHKTFVDSPTKGERAVMEKYKSPKYKRVALMKPVILNLENLSDEE